MKQLVTRNLFLAPIAALSLAVGISSCTQKGRVASDGGFPVDKVFRTEVNGDVGGFNLLTENTANQTQVLTYVYEALLTRNLNNWELSPLIAKKWEVSEDGKTFTFEIDEKAKWPDGQPITAADVQFTMDVMFHPKMDTAVLRSVYGSLDPKLVIESPRKFSIKAKTEHFKNLELAGGFDILPKHLLEDEMVEGEDGTLKLNKGKLMTGTYGSGPYELMEWKQGEQIVIKKRPDYWGAHVATNKDAYNFDRIVFKIIRDTNVAIEKLKEGYFSMYSFNSERWERDSKNEKIQKYYDTYDFINKRPNGYSYVAWNNAKSPFTDRNVRIALWKLMNRKFMIEKFTFGHALPAIGPIGSTSIYAQKDTNKMKFDPEGAIKMLSEAGWKDSNNDGVLEKAGKTFEFTLLFSNADTEKYLTIYKEDLAKAGVKMNLKQVDWTSFVKKLDERDFDAVILGWTASVDPDLYQIWHSDGIKGTGSNFMSYKNAEVDKLLIAAQKEFDRDKRIALNQKLSAIIANDAPYAFFLEQPKNFIAARKGIQRPKDYLEYSLGHYYWQPPAQ